MVQNRNTVIFNYQSNTLFLCRPLCGWLGIGSRIYFYLSNGIKMLSITTGGLLAIEAVAIGMTSASQVLHEIEANLEVLLLLVFMVAGIYFMKQLLLFGFTKIITKVRSKILVSLMFCLASAFYQPS